MKIIIGQDIHWAKYMYIAQLILRLIQSTLLSQVRYYITTTQQNKFNNSI